jgi:hypothetical protein
MLTDMGGNKAVVAAVHRSRYERCKRTILPNEIDRLDTAHRCDTHGSVLCHKVGLRSMIDDGSLLAFCFG